MSLIHRIATLEMFRVATQHQQSTEASSRRTNEMVSEQLNDITDQFMELCEKHHALKKRHEKLASLAVEFCNETMGYSRMVDTLFQRAELTPEGVLSWEAVQKMVEENMLGFDRDLELEKSTRTMIETRLSQPSQA